MLRKRNYWTYSAGLAIAWAVVLILARTIRGSEDVADLPVGLWRLLYRLGVDDDCPICLSTAKALELNRRNATRVFLLRLLALIFAL